MKKSNKSNKTNKFFKCLGQIKINEKNYNIVGTKHSLARMKERNIDEYVVVGNVLALGKERLNQLQAAHEEAIIIDELTNTSIVIAFCQNRIVVITVIDKSNVFVKNHTKIVNL